MIQRTLRTRISSLESPDDPARTFLQFLELLAFGHQVYSVRFNFRFFVATFAEVTCVGSVSILGIGRVLPWRNTVTGPSLEITISIPSIIFENSAAERCRVP